MSDKKIVLKKLNNSELGDESIKKRFHYVIKPDGSWIQFMDDKESKKIVIGCVRDNQGELFKGAQDAGLSELVRILGARHKISCHDVSFESDGFDHQNLGNICTQTDCEQLEFWKNSDVAVINGKTKKLPVEMMERKGILFAPLHWLMNALGFERFEMDNYLKFWRKK